MCFKLTPYVQMKSKPQNATPSPTPQTSHVKMDGNILVRLHPLSCKTLVCCRPGIINHLRLCATHRLGFSGGAPVINYFRHEREILFFHAVSDPLLLSRCESQRASILSRPFLYAAVSSAIIL